LPVQIDPDLGHSLKRNDSSSMISRSAQELPKLMMSFPTGWVRLLDDRNNKEQESLAAILCRYCQLLSSCAFCCIVQLSFADKENPRYIPGLIEGQKMKRRV